MDLSGYSDQLKALKQRLLEETRVVARVSPPTPADREALAKPKPIHLIEVSTPRDGFWEAEGETEDGYVVYGSGATHEAAMRDMVRDAQRYGHYALYRLPKG